MKELIAKPVNKALNEYGAIIDLIDRSFPGNEKYPFWLIRLWGMIPVNNFLAFYDQGVFVGVMLNFCTKNAVFVLYLVVNDQVRSSGYGSSIIQWAKAHYGNSCIILNVESPDEMQSFYLFHLICVLIKLFDFLFRYRSFRCENDQLMPGMSISSP